VKFYRGKSAKSCFIYPTNKQKTKFRLPIKLSLLRESRPKSVMVQPQQFAQTASDFIQIGSLSAESIDLIDWSVSLI